MRKGQKMSDEQKVKLSNSRKGKFCGSSNPHWRGGKIIVGGYIYIFNPTHPFSTKDGYICEHRLVMEKKLGRFLEPSERIHHLNHNRLDNREDNLYLCVSNGKHFIEYHLNKRDGKGRFKSSHIPLS
jgi:hypothetical protein